MIYLVDFFELIAINYIVAQRPVFSVLFTVFQMIFLYGFRTFDIEHKELQKQLPRAFFGNIFAVFVFSLLSLFFKFKLGLFNYSLITVFSALLVSITNSSILNSFTGRKKEKVLVIGRRNEIGHIMDEIEQKSNGKFIFADYINPSREVLVKKNFKLRFNISS